MATLRLKEGDGTTRIELEPKADGTPVSVTLDVYEANNAYCDLQAQHPAVSDLGAAWAAWLEAKGLPGLSHGQAFDVADHLAAEVEAFKKKGSGSPTPG